jgi:hypothetical protein
LFVIRLDASRRFVRAIVSEDRRDRNAAAHSGEQYASPFRADAIAETVTARTIAPQLEHGSSGFRSSARAFWHGSQNIGSE